MLMGHCLLRNLHDFASQSWSTLSMANMLQRTIFFSLWKKIGSGINTEENNRIGSVIQWYGSDPWLLILEKNYAKVPHPHTHTSSVNYLLLSSSRFHFAALKNAKITYPKSYSLYKAGFWRPSSLVTPRYGTVDVIIITFFIPVKQNKNNLCFVQCCGSRISFSLDPGSRMEKLGSGSAG